MTAPIRDKVGGRWAVSLPLYLAVAPLGVASGVMFAAADPSARGFTAALAASALSYLAMGAVLLLADVTVLRNRRLRPVGVATVAGVGAAAGIVRSLSAMGFGQALGLPELAGAEVASRLVSSGLLGATLLPLSAFVVASVVDFRAERNRLVDERVALHRSLVEGERRVGTLRDVLAQSGLGADALAQAADSLEAAVRAGSGAPSVSDPGRLGQALRHLADDTVRPLSHRVRAAAQPRRPPRLRWSTVVDCAMRQHPFPIALVLLLWFVSAWPGEWARWGLRDSLAVLLSLFAATAACFGVGRWLVRRWPGTRYVAFVAVVSVVVVIGSALTRWLIPQMTAAQLASNAIATFVWLSVLTLTTSLALAALSQADELVADLSGQVSDAQVRVLALEAAEAAQLRALSHYLHAEVQSRILAAAWAADEVDPAERPTLVSTVDDLARRLRELESSTRGSEAAQASLHDVVARWRGLVDVDVESVPDSLCATRAIVEEVDEAVANAYRHGRATCVHVAWCPQIDGFDIVVDDDGAGPLRGGAGLGSGVFSSTCSRGWDLTPGALGGSRLTLRHGTGPHGASPSA